MTYSNANILSQRESNPVQRFAEWIINIAPFQRMSEEDRHYQQHLQRLAETSPHLLDDIGVESAAAQD